MNKIVLSLAYVLLNSTLVNCIISNMNSLLKPISLNRQVSSKSQSTQLMITSDDEIRLPSVVRSISQHRYLALYKSLHNANFFHIFTL